MGIRFFFRLRAWGAEPTCPGFLSVSLHCRRSMTMTCHFQNRSQTRLLKCKVTRLKRRPAATFMPLSQTSCPQRCKKRTPPFVFSIQRLFLHTPCFFSSAANTQGPDLGEWSPLSSHRLSRCVRLVLTTQELSLCNKGSLTILVLTV